MSTRPRFFFERYNVRVPELPEVEVLRRSLAPHLAGRTFVDVTVRESKLRERIRPAELQRRCRGRRIIELRRRAKYLIVDLEGGVSLLVHLGMSGGLTVQSLKEAKQPHEHVVWRLDDGRTLRFTDPRRFGLILVRATNRLDGDRHLAHLGVEPFDGRFDGEYLRRAAGTRRVAVKQFLMDGTVVVGVGNIYASEALHRAGIHPRRAVARIAAARWRRLAAAVTEVLDQAIEQGGTTLNDFSDGNGRRGYFQVALDVYDREGEACRRCAGTICRVVLGGRSTYYCPRCQR